MSCSLAKSGSIAGERDHVEREVPGRVPRVLPLVGHRDDVAVVQVLPVAVAAVLAACGRRRLVGIAVEPVLDDVVVELLAPEQPGVRLPRDAALVVRERRPGCDRRRTRRPRAMRVGEDRRRSPRPNGSGRPRPSSREPQRGARTRPPGRDRRAGSAAPPWCRARRVDRVVLARRRRSRETRPSRTASAFAPPKSRSTLVSFSVNSSLGRRLGRRRLEPAAAPASRDRVERAGRRPARMPRLDARSLRACTPRTRCCGTRASAAGERRGLRAAVGDGDPDQDVVRRRPWRTRRRRRSSGRRRRRRCRAARTPDRPCRAGGSLRPAARRETRPAGTCRAPSCSECVGVASR